MNAYGSLSILACRSSSNCDMLGLPPHVPLLDVPVLGVAFSSVRVPHVPNGRSAPGVPSLPNGRSVPSVPNVRNGRSAPRVPDVLWGCEYQHRGPHRFATLEVISESR